MTTLPAGWRINPDPASTALERMQCQPLFWVRGGERGAKATGGVETDEKSKQGVGVRGCRRGAEGAGGGG